MGYNAILEAIVEEKLMSLNTAYVAKVLSVNGSKAKVQPLNMVKAYGEPAKRQSPVTAHIHNNARYKLKKQKLTYVSDVVMHSPQYETIEVMVSDPISAGDIVFCVCADRDITEAKKGNMTVPPIGHHSMSDSVIVGIL